MTGINPGAWGGAGTLSAQPINQYGAGVQGYKLTGTSVDANVRPVVMGVADALTAANVRVPLSDNNGRLDTLVTPAEEVRTAYEQTIIAEPHLVLGGRAMFGLSSYDMGTRVNGNGLVTHNSGDASIDLSVAGVNNDNAEIKTHRSTLAQTGRSGGPTIHFRFGVSNANTEYIVSITDSANAYGFGIMEKGGVIYIVLFHPGAGGRVLIPQSSWNRDKLDGQGKSKATLTNLNTTFHTVNGIGAGDGGFSTKIFLNGAHIHTFGPIPSALYFPRFAWRIGAQVKNTAAAAAGVLSVKSWEFNTYGDVGEENAQFVSDFVNRAGVLSTSTTELPLMAVRPSATAGGVTNETSIFPVEFSPNFNTQGDITFTAYYQVGGADPFAGGTGWAASTLTPHDFYITATTFTANANTRKLGTTGSSTGGKPIDFTKWFGDGNKLAIRRRFNDGLIEAVYITARARSGTYDTDGTLAIRAQANI
jgi:hypothetical protein